MEVVPGSDIQTERAQKQEGPLGFFYRVMIDRCKSGHLMVCLLPGVRCLNVYRIKTTYLINMGA